jgi:hypothetical protein
VPSILYFVPSILCPLISIHCSMHSTLSSSPYALILLSFAICPLPSTLRKPLASCMGWKRQRQSNNEGGVGQRE